MIKGLLLDMGGVLYEGDKVIEGAVETINELKKNYKIRYLSNTSRVTPKSLVKKLKNYGFSIEENEIFTALDAAKLFLKNRKSSAYVIATDEAKEYFDDLKTYKEQFVLVCDAYKNFNYENLNRAFRHLEEGYGFLATNINRYFKDSDLKLSLDAGGFVKCLEYASGKSAKVIGKPNCEFFSLAISDMGLTKDEVLMIGDDIESDILGAKGCWLKTVMVKTGKYKDSDLLKGKPDFLIDSINNLSELLENIE